MSDRYKVQVYGMGVVGACTALQCLELGHQVSGVEVDREIRRKFKSNDFSVWSESGVYSRLKDFSSEKKFEIVEDPPSDADISIVCVGTPVKQSGKKDLSFLFSAIKEICKKQINQNRKMKHTIVVRSTIPPGTSQKEIFKLLENELGYEWEETVCYIYLPEFLREGQALEDTSRPALQVFSSNQRERKKLLGELFAIDFREVAFETAEMIKYYSNSFHALKVAFSNEVASIAHQYDVDLQELTEVFLSDHQLNISEAYLRPGFAYGGACLPKDLACINRLAADKNVVAPILSSIANSNSEHIRRSAEAILSINPKKVGIIGLGFKPKAKSLRNSPVVELAHQLKLSSNARVLALKDELREGDALFEVANSLESLMSKIDVLVLGHVDRKKLASLNSFDGVIFDLNQNLA